MVDFKFGAVATEFARTLVEGLERAWSRSRYKSYVQDAHRAELSSLNTTLEILRYR